VKKTVEKKETEKLRKRENPREREKVETWMSPASPSWRTSAHVGSDQEREEKQRARKIKRERETERDREAEKLRERERIPERERMRESRNLDVAGFTQLADERARG
jgi:hypothetical protein